MPQNDLYEEDNIESILPATNGVIQDVDYYYRPELSCSDLKLIYKSINHWIWNRHAKATPAMNFGKAFHMYMLEPEKYQEKVRIKATPRAKPIPDGDPEALAISADEDYSLKQMAEQLSKSTIATDLLYSSDCEYEKELYFKYSDLDMRSKLDVINIKGKYVADIKTISDAYSVYGLKKQIFTYSYDMQMVFYRMAVSIIYNIPFEDVQFYFIFIEKKPPFGVRTVQLTDNFRVEGLSKIEYAINKYKNYLENGIADTYPEGILTLDFQPNEYYLMEDSE